MTRLLTTKKNTLAISLILGAQVVALTPSMAFMEEITFESTDGIKIYGDWYKTNENKNTPLILLFHQGGANSRAEYKTIWPILNKEGYNVLAVDARRGGDRLGGTNRTAANLESSKYGYCDAYGDVKATLRFAQSSGQTGPIIVWGSSYSAALVINLTNENPDKISATLAFSPASGGPLKDCNPNQHATTLTTPLLLLRPRSEMEFNSAKTQFELFKKAGHETYVAENGVHGSSMLNPDRIEGSNQPTWKVVKTFIKNALSKK